VTDAGLPAVAKMPRITSLDISHLTLTERSLVGLRELPNLVKLTMLKSQFPSNPCLFAIGQIESLHELTLSETPISDTDLAGLRGMKNLRVLHLDFTPLTDAAFEHLATLPNLEVLTISQTKITSRGLQKLVGSPAGDSLRVLDVHKTSAGNNGFGQLDGLRALEELDASTAQVSDKSLTGWASPPELRLLNLSENPFTNNSLPAILKSPRLKELILQKVTGVNDPGLNHIVKKTSLTFIQLDQSGVSLQSAQLLKQKMPNTKVGIAGTIY
jgi:Leucine-rich repeat (LRR) protein